MSEFFLSGKILSAKQGTVYFDFNGITQKVMHLVDIEAKVEKNKEEVGQVGEVMSGWKSTGMKGTGTAKLKMCTPEARQLMQQYAETGQDFYFDIKVTNEDPSSPNIGAQTIILKRCNADSVKLFKVSSANGTVEEDLPFTFERFLIQEPFTPLSGMFSVENPIDEILAQAITDKVITPATTAVTDATASAQETINNATS